MKKVYILFNDDIGEIVDVSEDEDLLREIMCDYFMDDVEYQFYFEQQYNDIEVDRACLWARELWEDMMDWYTKYMYIIEKEVI